MRKIWLIRFCVNLESLSDSNHVIEYRVIFLKGFVKKMKNETPLLVYAAYAGNIEIRLNSSSGGIFSLLAEYIIALKGVVYGVAMTEDCKAAEYIRVINRSGLIKLRGSKYLQAKMGNTFTNVREDLQNDAFVLFTGTPCQINGLKKFLGKEYDKLFCVDVVCHGAPSSALWQKYVEYVEEKNNAKLVHINFRCKDDNWMNFGMEEINPKHKQVYISKDVDPYMQMFLRDYCLRPSCYDCKVKKEKLSDITIADFWGIGNIEPGMNDGNGTSLVLVRTEKGLTIFDNIKSEMTIKEVTYEDGVKSNPAEYKSPIRPLQRDKFFTDMISMDFETLAREYAIPNRIAWKYRIKQFVKAVLLKTSMKRILGRKYSLKQDKGYGLLFTLNIQVRSE